MPVPVSSVTGVGLLPLSYAWIRKQDETGAFRRQEDPFWIVARSFAEQLPDVFKGRPCPYLDRNVFPSLSMLMGPNALIRVGQEGCQATPLDILRHNSQLTILSFEHFFPELGMPACVNCGSNKDVVRDGWAKELRRYFTLDFFRGVILSAQYKCKDCPGKWSGGDTKG
jgi:hypothetical protein